MTVWVVAYGRFDCSIIEINYMNVDQKRLELSRKMRNSAPLNSHAERFLKIENYTRLTSKLKFDYHCLLKHLTRKIKSTVNRCFDAVSIILKIEVVHGNVKVVI